MEFLRFFREESTRSLRRMAHMAIIAGAANGFLLAVINMAAESATQSHVSIRYFVLFLIALITFVYAKNYAMSEATLVVEQVLQKVRLRITDKIRKTELSFIENLGFGRLFTAVAHDTDVISQSAVVLIGAATSLTMLVASLFYIAYLSLLAFAITIVAVLLGGTLYISHRKELIADYHHTAETEGRFFEALSNVLKGFKQLKTNRRRSEEVYGNLVTIAGETEAIKIRTGLKSTVDYIFSQTFHYSLIAVIIFVMPFLVATHEQVVIKLTAAILFIIGPLDLIVGSFPLFARSTVAIRNLRKIESELDAVKNGGDEAVGTFCCFEDFKKISLNNLVYKYREDDGHVSFSVGPIDFSIERGNIIFIVGGNGSGKSTLLKLLTGLYRPSEGSIQVDGKELLREEVAEYRELFAPIFGDFHLFDRLYGLSDVDPQAVDQLLHLMQIQDKTRFVDGRFTNVDLSTGQRKRLAMIAALLEDKAIYIFDEWAADQDPEFKDYFYQVLLADMKKQGKTVIAVTHDDRYFSLADTLIKMEFGKICESR